jgi:hypothetical protein
VIHVLDTLAVRPGLLGEVQHQVQDAYQPMVGDLDMNLVHTWMAPAVNLVDRPTDLLFLWELEDVPAYWRMRLAAARDSRIVAFWQALEPLLAGRERRLMCDPDDASVLR